MYWLLYSCLHIVCIRISKGVITISSIDIVFGIILGYFIGVIKEKLRWVEKYISSRKAEQLLGDKMSDEE